MAQDLSNQILIPKHHNWGAIPQQKDKANRRRNKQVSKFVEPDPKPKTPKMEDNAAEQSKYKQYSTELA